MNLWIASLALLLTAALTHADVVSKPVEYKDGDVKCVGMLVYDDAKAPEARAGVLVIPEWWGLTEYPKSRARQLADLGYVAFVADMYGGGKTTSDPKQAGEWAAIRNDPPAFRQRAMAGLESMRAQAKEAQLDPKRIAAIGYCFGGSAVLELARGGADLAGVVSFHGGLELPGDLPEKIKPRILLCHGAADPMVPPQQLQSLINRLEKIKADYQVNIYAGALHAFTNPDADKFKIPGIGYNRKADQRSWQAMKQFLAEVLNVKS